MTGKGKADGAKTRVHPYRDGAMVNLGGERQSFENVETVSGGRDDSTWYLRVPVNFLDIRLTLVTEQELSGNVFESIGFRSGRSLVFVFFDREVPQCHLVVGSRGGETRVFGRVPFDRGDRCRVPVESSDRSRRRGFRSVFTCKSIIRNEALPSE